MGSRTRWQPGSSTVSRRRLPRVAAAAIGAALLAGCGSTAPRLDRATSGPLIALAERISTEGACAQARDIRTLQGRAIALVNARKVPAALQEPLVSAVNALAEETPACLPPVPATAPPPRPAQRPHGHGKHHGHDKHENGDKG
jgi:hypothetical protein